MKKVDIAEKYDLNSVPQNWDRYDFAWVLDKLENAPSEKLIELCRLPQIEIQFSDSKLENVPRDEIISALTADCTADILIPTIVLVMYKSE